MVHARHLDVAVSMLLFLAGAYISYVGGTYGYLEEGAPAAGFFPLWIGFGVMAFSAVNLFNALRRVGMVRTIDTAEILRVVLCSLAMIAFVWLGGRIGMVTASYLLMLAIGAIFGPRTRTFYAFLAIVSAGMTAVLYVVFGILLSVPLL